MKDAFETAGSLLSRRPHSQAELRRKLRAKGFLKEEVDFAISECLRLGFIDDKAFANSFADQMLSRGCGSRRISQKLTMRGVDRDLASEATASSSGRDGGSDELSSACEALRKKLKSFEREEDPRKRRLKALRFLAGRGFSGDIANKAIASHPSLIRRSPTEGF